MQLHVGLATDLWGANSMGDKRLQALNAYSRGEMIALQLRGRLGGATFGEVLMLLGAADLPLPRAPVEGREEQFQRPREWMFPKHAA